MLAWSLDAVADASVAAVVIAAPRGSEDEVGELAHAAGVDAQVVPGGATRGESVANALEAVQTELVAVHDAARPLVTPGLFDAVLATLIRQPDADGAIAAAAIADTLKRTGAPAAQVIEETVSRDGLWAAQTPQAFRTEKLRAAYAADPARVAAATDEAMLIEGAGGRVMIEPVAAPNLKVTTPADLRLAELLLASRGSEPS